MAEKLKKKSNRMEGLKSSILGKCDDSPLGSSGQGARFMRKPSFSEKLRRHMSAIAFAEAGDHQSVELLLDPLGGSSTILLVTSGENVDQKTFNHAVQLSKRIDAELDVLQIIPYETGRDDAEELAIRMASASRNLAQLVPVLEKFGLRFKITIRLGSLDEKLFNYAKRHKDVRMVILDDPILRDAHQPDKWDDLVAKVSRNLSIPLVTVLHKDELLAV